jgi:uncharacterized protein (DUF2267 family)
MSAVGLEGIDHAVQQAHIWINDVEKRMDWNSKPRAYRLLKSVLHALRDHLQVNEAVDLGAQLPTLIRGDPLDDTAEAAAVVFSLLSDRITAGEIADVRQSLPAQIRALWPAAAGEARVRA